MTKRKLIKGTHKGAPSTRFVFLSFPDLSLPLSLSLSFKSRYSERRQRDVRSSLLSLLLCKE